MTAHTPGPWMFVPAARSGHVHRIAAKGREFAQVGGTGTDEEQDANARLIAAAPDMAAILGELADAYECYANRLDQDGFDSNDERELVTVARAALGKAGVVQPNPVAAAEPEETKEPAAIAPVVVYARRRGSKLVHRYRSDARDHASYDRSACGKFLGIHCVLGDPREHETLCHACKLTDVVRT